MTVNVSQTQITQGLESHYLLKSLTNTGHETKEEALFYTLHQLLAFLLEPHMLFMAVKANQLHSCLNFQRGYLLGAISDSVLGQAGL